MTFEPRSSVWSPTWSAEWPASAPGESRVLEGCGRNLLSKHHALDYRHLQPRTLAIPEPSAPPSRPQPQNSSPSHACDPGLADHGVRTAHVAAAIASEMGLSLDETDRAISASPHDIGKLGIPEAVLWKPTGLDTSE